MIKEEAVEAVKKAMQIDDLMPGGTQMRQFGANYHCTCPFHPDPALSFEYAPGHIDKRFKCRSCGVEGDPIQLNMLLKNLSIEDSIKDLASMYNITVLED